MAGDLSIQAETAMLSAQNRKPQMPKPPANASIAKLREVSQDFEAVFLAQMLQPMFANLGAEKPFGGGLSEGMWRSKQVEEYGKAIVKNGGIGLADAVFREMLKMQESNKGAVGSIAPGNGTPGNDVKGNIK